jgi:N-acetylmuramoyl-L-alanine amidase
MPVLLSTMLYALFATAALHWYQINREYATSTIVYAYRRSPNFDDRPAESKISCVVLQAAGQDTLEAATKALQDPNSKISTHFVVSSSGEILQTVPIERRAWHAGASQLDGQVNVDDFSVGIELLNANDGAGPYSGLQYKAVARIISQLRQRYEIPDRRIVPVSQIALPLGGKPNPEGFDFAKLRELLNSLPAAPSHVGATIRSP